MRLPVVVGLHYFVVPSLLLSVSVRPAHTKYARLQKSGGARTVLMTKFASRALYAVPHVRVKSEIYFGLYQGLQFY